MALLSCAKSTSLNLDGSMVTVVKHSGFQGQRVIGVHGVNCSIAHCHVVIVLGRSGIARDQQIFARVLRVQLEVSHPTCNYFHCSGKELDLHLLCGNGFFYSPLVLAHFELLSQHLQASFQHNPCRKEGDTCYWSGLTLRCGQSTFVFSEADNHVSASIRFLQIKGRLSLQPRSCEPFGDNRHLLTFCRQGSRCHACIWCRRQSFGRATNVPISAMLVCWWERTRLETIKNRVHPLLLVCIFCDVSSLMMFTMLLVLLRLRIDGFLRGSESVEWEVTLVSGEDAAWVVICPQREFRVTWDWVINHVMVHFVFLQIQMSVFVSCKWRLVELATTIVWAIWRQSTLCWISYHVSSMADVKLCKHHSFCGATELPILVFLVYRSRVHSCCPPVRGVRCQQLLFTRIAELNLSR